MICTPENIEAMEAKEKALAGTNYSSSFTECKKVKDCIQRLYNHFDEQNPLIVSDVLDQDGHQYVHLVQKGGGVLGVALVGYTYILEEMGIRFIRLAGTSAGAINTALMTVVGSKKNDKGELCGDKTIKKSSQILDIMGTLDFFGLVDGHVAARKIIKTFVTVKDLGLKLKKASRIAAIIMGIVFMTSFIGFGLKDKYAAAGNLAKIAFVCSGIILTLVGILVSYSAYLFTRLRVSGYGINPGKYFHCWVDRQFKNNEVETVADLRKVSETPVIGLHLREGVEGNLDGLEGDVTFITSELVTENKIEFPLMSEYFTDDISTLHPADFIRASMSIPIFFESFIIKNIPFSEPAIKKCWAEHLGEDDPPSIARFVDGGILSNFPINIFYNAKVPGKPRLPSFGIDLDDELAPEGFLPEYGDACKKEKDGDKSKDPDKWSLVGYIGRLFNTTRYYYDKDFLIKNAFFKKGIGKIPLKKFNWLNFFMQEKDKQEMFLLGALAAEKFLKEFKWNKYKGEREVMNQQILK